MPKQNKLQINLKPVLENIEVLTAPSSISGIDLASKDQEVDLPEELKSVLVEKSIASRTDGTLELTEKGVRIHGLLEKISSWEESELDDVNDVTVLVGEDEPMQRELYKRQLPGVNVAFTMSENEFFNKLTETDTDLIILERMFDHSTQKLVKQIRELPTEIPIVIITTIKPDAGIVDWKIDDYLIKPVGTHEIRKAISRIVKVKHLTLYERQTLLFIGKKANLEMEKDYEELMNTKEYLKVLEELESLQNKLI